jgi:acyl-CoA dehydrogenase
MELEERLRPEVFEAFGKLGLPGLMFRKQYGGSEADAITAGIAGEEIARADISCSTAVLFLVPAVWGFVLEKYGSLELAERVLPSVARGKSFLGIATTEPGAGSDVASIRTTATPQGDSFVLKGEKLYISGVREATSDMPDGGGYLVLAKTSPEKGAKGLTFFYVPVRDQPGVTVSMLSEMGRRALSSGGILLDNLKVPRANIVGEVDRGFFYALEGFDLARAIISVVCAGAAMSAVEMGMEYLRERDAFGRKIGKYQGIQFKLAENFAKLDAARLLGYRALWMYDQAAKGDESSRWEVTRAIAEAKMLAPVFAFEAINDVLQWYGAFGYTQDCPIEMGLRGVRSYMLAEGSTEIMKVIVARELLGREFLAT